VQIEVTAMMDQSRHHQRPTADLNIPTLAPAHAHVHAHTCSRVHMHTHTHTHTLTLTRSNTNRHSLVRSIIFSHSSTQILMTGARCGATTPHTLAVRRHDRISPQGIACGAGELPARCAARWRTKAVMSRRTCREEYHGRMNPLAHACSHSRVPPPPPSHPPTNQPTHPLIQRVHKKTAENHLQKVMT
jgi:hypothetical protein